MVFPHQNALENVQLERAGGNSTRDMVPAFRERTECPTEGIGGTAVTSTLGTVARRLDLGDRVGVSSC
jgi:hypothetical protein